MGFMLFNLKYGFDFQSDAGIFAATGPDNKD